MYLLPEPYVYDVRIQGITLGAKQCSHTHNSRDPPSKPQAVPCTKSCPKERVDMIKNLSKENIDGGFLKQGYPQIIHFNSVFRYGNPQMFADNPRYKTPPRNWFSIGLIHFQVITRDTLFKIQGLGRDSISKEFFGVSYLIQYSLGMFSTTKIVPKPERLDEYP